MSRGASYSGFAVRTFLSVFVFTTPILNFYSQRCMMRHSVVRTLHFEIGRVFASSIGGSLTLWYW